MAKYRHMNPQRYFLINDLWKKEFGIENVIKLKFTLTYFNGYLERYLDACKKRFD